MCAPCVRLLVNSYGTETAGPHLSLGTLSLVEKYMGRMMQQRKVGLVLVQTFLFLKINVGDDTWSDFNEKKIKDC